MGTVTRSGSTAQAVVILLDSNLPSQLGVPPQALTLPAGHASLTFVIRSKDNGLVDAGNRVRIFAGANDYNGAQANIFVRNTTPLRVTIQVDRTVVREGPQTFVQVYLRRNFAFSNAVTVFPSSSDPARLTVPEKVVFRAGSTQTSFVAQVVDNERVDAPARVTLSISKPNTPIFDSVVITVEDDEVPELRVKIEPESFSESDGPNAAVGTVTRTTNPTQAMTVTLATSDAGEATVPPSVVIPAGSFSATFPVSAVDDADRDGLRRLTISAIKTGLRTGGFVVSVTDDESQLVLTISPRVINETDGANAATGTVRRGSGTSTDLLVRLSNFGNSNTITIPETVTIAAGSREATFSIGVINNDITDGTRSIFLRATADGYEQASAFGTVLDDDKTITISLGTITLVESGGQTQTNAFIRLSEAVTEDLLVTLTNSDPGEASLPASVTVAKGTSGVGFVIRAVDDAEDDGVQTVFITASADGFRTGRASVNVYDNEGPNEPPGLKIFISPATISENGGEMAATGTVTRNTPTGSGMTVSLLTSDSSIVRVPANITIPVGSTSVTFPIAAVDNASADGTRSVEITAFKSGLQSGVATVSVSDDESGAAPMAMRAAPKLSTLRADAARSEIGLTFSGPIDANLASRTDRYAVEIDGKRVAVEGVTVNQSTLSVRLRLPVGALIAGAGVRVWWGLSSGETVLWNSTVATAR